jgi:hypothetical protein
MVLLGFQPDQIAHGQRLGHLPWQLQSAGPVEYGVLDRVVGLAVAGRGVP